MIGSVERLSAIVPATDRPAALDAVVSAIWSAAEPPEEVIVITEPAGLGPSAARNAGARRAAGEILVFVDADVEVHADAFALIRQAFVADAKLAAVFGSYDDDPRARTLVSDFRNLLHHHVHHEGAGPAETFWAGLGAVRTEAFFEVGGFDERRFSRPSVEDVELGGRLRVHGHRIVLDPRIQGTHLKRWSLAGMVRTDFLDRGIPWTELVLSGSGHTSSLNLGWRHRASALASLVLTGSILVRRRKLALGALGSLTVLNLSFYRLLRRRRGALQVVAGVPLHLVHHVTGVAAMVTAVGRMLRRSLGR